ncbi:hypothetical protein QFZ69_002593 [Arthrobacter sp. V1I7]|uniref:DUF4347 domain-containing protein n=1 Tax=Arthrobacter sp. V1I7 TaxID=3042274 RepID=UPI0027816D6D|nr:DUF4347 domain-containing protein [Arthrobacter sp. V1I7]MDQ0821714.1 hypothetical protein [Arthrobacter sp. V1I7]
MVALQRQVGNRATSLLLQRWDPGPLPGDDALVESADRRHAPPATIEVSVIDDSDMVGWMASFTRTGEVYMVDTRTMVANVRKAISPRQTMHRLNILDHGNSAGIEIGRDFITSANVASFTPLLSSLRPLFSPGGSVHIQHCDAGQNRPLIVGLARAFGVPVYAGTGAHNPVYRINFGDYVRGNPDGSFEAKVGRP